MAAFQSDCGVSNVSVPAAFPSITAPISAYGKEVESDISVNVGNYCINDEKRGAKFRNAYVANVDVDAPKRNHGGDDDNHMIEKRVIIEKV